MFTSSTLTAENTGHILWWNSSNVKKQHNPDLLQNISNIYIDITFKGIQSAEIIINSEYVHWKKKYRQDEL